MVWVSPLPHRWNFFFYRPAVDLGRMEWAHTTVLGKTTGYLKLGQGVLSRPTVRHHWEPGTTYRHCSLLLQWIVAKL